MVISPSIDPHKLSIEDKIKLVRESDGLLIELLENTKIEHLDLFWCSSLTHLPEGLEVGGSLNLYECSSLTSLPEGLKVGGNLNLYKCSSLNHLPEGLEVGRDLNLRGCTSLTHLPEDLKVGGEIFGWRK